jgi:hypothetical protein
MDLHYDNETDLLMIKLTDNEMGLHTDETDLYTDRNTDIYTLIIIWTYRLIVIWT